MSTNIMVHGERMEIGRKKIKRRKDGGEYSARVISIYLKNDDLYPSFQLTFFEERD